MRGTMLIFRPHELRPTVREINRAPTLDDLKAGIGGGYLEKVPGFTTVAYGDIVMDCVALCDEDGKNRGYAFNRLATAAWDRALQRSGFGGLMRPNGRLADYLVGPVITLFGDKEFMEAL